MTTFKLSLGCAVCVGRRERGERREGNLSQFIFIPQLRNDSTRDAE
jgi:hypothetical protein